uniref:Uncharacterized protein n=1 Tax=Nelumbo nucifera TaxID=4432 RepID=A0A822XQH8_NELNU|nr:TPA_asm: hypothetical protein HUJ06_022448 [Nelumbo nucifera]
MLEGGSPPLIQRIKEKIICLFIKAKFFLLANGNREHYHLRGLIESPSVDDDGECFSVIVLNATSVNIEVYYNKAVNYTLMVTFVSFKKHYHFVFFVLLLSFGCWCCP